MLIMCCKRKNFKIDKHPNADRLSVCQIDVGKEILTIGGLEQLMLRKTILYR